jgi:uncharacterized membrane protein
MMTTSATDRLVQLVQGVENAEALDRVEAKVRPLVAALVADPGRRALLRGEWFGHGVHPALTDVPLGMWLSASVLDVVGGKAGRKSARRLIGLGVLSFFPTAFTGWAEWSSVEERRDRRTGVAHALLQGTGMLAYLASWVARRRGHQVRGMMLSTAGGMIAISGAYLGGHLSEVRKISTSHPAFQADHAFDGPGDTAYAGDSLEERLRHDFLEGHSDL